MRSIGLVLLAACGGGEEETHLHPALEFLSPADGATVPAGEVPVSIVVTDFDLAASEQTARSTPLPLPLLLLESAALAHGEGAPAGYVELSLDGSVVGQLDSTQLTLADVAAGPHELVGELFYADGDPLEEPVVVSIGFTAE